jgi:hypothetical protein
MIFYSWPWGYRRSYFWLPGLYSVALACWVLFVWPLIVVFWMTVWGFALVGWIIIEFYLGVWAIAVMTVWHWRGQEFDLHLRRVWLGRFSLMAVDVQPVGS